MLVQEDALCDAALYDSRSSTRGWRAGLTSWCVSVSFSLNSNLNIHRGGFRDFGITIDQRKKKKKKKKQSGLNWSSPECSIC